MSALLRGDFQFVEARVAVDEQRCHPGENEYADDGKADAVEVVIQGADAVPEPAFQAELITDQAKTLDPANQHGYDDGDGRDNEVVVELPHRFDEGPVVGT